MRFGKARHGLRLGDSPHRDPTQRRLVLNSRRRILDPSRWISEPYHNDGCRERWFALLPMFAALRKSASAQVFGRRHPRHQPRAAAAGVRKA